ASATGWQAYSALASGTVTCHVDVPVAPNPGPGPDPKPDPNRPVDPKITGVANSLETTDHRAYMVGNDQGQFLPDNGITRAEVSQFYSLLKDKGNSADKASFPDVKAGSWYTPAINTMAALGILSGYPDGSFKPSQCISRAEFTAVAMRFAKMTTGKVAFSDVSKDYWAYDAISGAAAYRWIMGYADGTFRPLANITRAEAARVVNTMLDRAGDKSFIDKATGLKLFPDVAKANWAFYEIVEATNSHNYTRDKAGNELWK
ncbi:MAG: S-layer homology domain-containing protein, partial [Oscillospiraceae bacterium]